MNLNLFESGNQIKKPSIVAYYEIIDTITVSGVEFGITDVLTQKVPNNSHAIHYVAESLGIAVCRHPHSRRAFFTHIQSWVALDHFETGMGILELLPHAVTFGKSVDWTLPIDKLKSLEKDNYDKYFFQAFLKLNNDCKAWYDPYRFR